MAVVHQERQQTALPSINHQCMCLSGLVFSLLLLFSVLGPFERQTNTHNDGFKVTGRATKNFSNRRQRFANTSTSPPVHHHHQQKSTPCELFQTLCRKQRHASFQTAARWCCFAITTILRGDSHDQLTDWLVWSSQWSVFCLLWAFSLVKECMLLARVNSPPNGSCLAGNVECCSCCFWNSGGNRQIKVKM